jgi:hypothetical protein
MRDWCDDLLAGLRIPADATAGLDAYCASRGWKADVTSRAADGATCVTIWPAALDLSVRADLDAALGRACVKAGANDPPGSPPAVIHAARQALCAAIAQHGQ